MAEKHDVVFGASRAGLSSHQIIVTGGEYEPPPPLATPFHEAAWFGEVELAEDCLDEGYFINSQDEEGNTPLHLAVKQGHQLMVQFLLDNRADIRCRNMAGEIPLDLAETGGSLADYLLKEADRRAQLDRKFQCSVTLGDGKVIGSSSKERLECWFTPLACQVHFEKAEDRRQPGCSWMPLRRKKKANTRPFLPSDSISLPHTSSVVVLDSLTVEITLAPKGSTVLPSPGQDDFPSRKIVAIKILMCLAEDTHDAIDRMLCVFHAEVLEVQKSLDLCMVMERETLPRLEGELEARRAELSALMRRCRTREAQDQAILRKDELKGVEKEIAEVRTSVQATRRQAVTLAQKTISKFEAQASSSTGAETLVSASQVPVLCRYIAIASDRGGTDSPLSGPAKLFGKGQRKQDLQSRISPMSHPSNQSSPTSKDSITFFSLPPIQLRPSLLRPEGSDGKTPAAAQGVLVSSPMDPSNCSPVVAGRQAEAQFFTPLNTEADVGRPVAVDVFVSSALRPEGTPFFTPVSGEEGESKDKQKALQSREEMAGGKERASPHGGRPTEEPQMQTIPETSPAKEKGIQGLSSGATEGSETADGTKGQEGRKEAVKFHSVPADLRVSRSSVTSSSEDLDGILFSRISTDKTPWAQRLTRPRPNGVPWLDLALVVPSPVDSRMSEDCKSGNEAADSQEAGAAGMASWQGDRAAALAGQAEAASPGTSLEMAGGWPVTSAWMPCEPPKCAPDLVSSLDMAAASSKQGHRRVQRDNAVAATQSLEGTAFLADASTPPCDLFECVIHVLPSHAVSSQAVKLPRHSRQGSHNSRYSGSGDEAAKHWSDGSESCSGTPRPEEAGPVPGHLPLDAVQATAVETPPLAGCDSPRLPSSPVRSSVTRMAELPQGPRATRASGSPVRVSPQTAPNAGGPIKQVSRAKLIAANFEERAAAAEGGQRPSRLKQVSAVALKAQAFERLSAGASGGLRRRGVQSNSKENGFGRPSVDRSHDNAVDSSSSELRKSVSALRPTQLGKAIRTEGQDPLACSSSSLRSSGNRCSITRAAPSPRAAPPKAAEPENKADRIASYPSRFVSGPAAAQYRTHDRLSNKSSHVGLVTVKKPFDKSSAGSAKAAPDASSGLKQPAARRGADGHPLTKLNTNTGGEGKKVLQPWMF